MSLPHAVLEFDNRGIISPVGYNDSGKSAITRALEVLWFDEYTQSQVKFITDGQSSFVISNLFDDGVLIQRTKYADGRSFWLMQQGSNIIYTNKLPSGTFAATKGVPEAISQYLGVVQDVATGETLNVRRNTDKLLLVSTTGGENYKIFNNLCQGDKLAYAVSEINKDINTKNRELSAKMSRLQGKKEVLSSMRVFSEEVERNLTELSSNLDKQSEKLSMLTALAQHYESFSCRAVIDEIQSVNLDRLRVLSDIKTKFSALNVEISAPIDTVNLEQLNLLQRIRDITALIKGTIIADIPIVDAKRLDTLTSLQTLFYSNAQTEAHLESEMAKVKQERRTLRQLAVENNFRVCPNCGAIVGEHDTCEGVI